MSPKEILEDIQSKIPIGTSLKDALTIFVHHFETTSVDGCTKENEDDRLLFEWGGPYSWNSNFSIDLTRQFSHTDEDGEYSGMEQLHMRCNFDANEIEIAPNNAWYEGTGVQSFLQMILNSVPVTAASIINMKSIEFELHDV